MTVATALEDQLGAPVFHPGRPGYAEEVAGFNLASTHTPDLVVGATNATDVVAAMRWAAERSMPVAVQATGHGATSAIEGGLLISTRRMNDVAVDARARTATVGAGATWRTVLAVGTPHGLAGLNGSATGVGVVGYTVGGGLPVLGRAHGWAAERVRRMEVVTADGRLHRADAATEPELFWALRGGKGNVGIVTSMTFELLPLTRIYGGGLVFPGERAAEVLAGYAEWAPSLPDTMSTALQLLRLPPFPDVPEPLRGRFVARLAVAHTGGATEAERLLAPMRALAAPMLDGLEELPYTRVDEVYSDPDHPVPAEEGSLLLDGLSAPAVGTLLEQAGPGVDSPLLLVVLRHMGGALARPAAVDDAICARDARFLLQTVGIPAGPRAAEVPGALAGLLTAMAPHSTGRTFVNLHGRPGSDADRARPWTPEVHDRLRRAKGRYDPAALLRYGHAVAPLPAAS